MYMSHLRETIENKLGGDLGAWLKHKYVEKGMTAEEMGEKLGVNHQTVVNWLREYKIGVRPKGWNLDKPSKEELQKMYASDGMRMSDIADTLEVNPTTIRNWLIEYKIPIRPKGWNLDRPSKEELQKMYVSDRMKMSDIADTLDVNRTTIRNWLTEYRIPIRPKGREFG